MEDGWEKGRELMVGQLTNLKQKTVEIKKQQ